CNWHSPNPRRVAMFPVPLTVITRSSTLHSAGHSDVLCHSERAVASNRMMASEGGGPGSTALGCSAVSWRGAAVSSATANVRRRVKRTCVMLHPECRARAPDEHVVRPEGNSPPRSSGRLAGSWLSPSFDFEDRAELPPGRSLELEAEQRRDRGRDVDVVDHVEARAAPDAASRG